MSHVFGLSFGELLVLAVVALVVVGPRQLPTLLRTLGQLIGKARRAAIDLRNESGIDEILRAEGLDVEIDNFRRIASGSLPLDVDPYRDANRPSPRAPDAPPLPASGDEPPNVATASTPAAAAPDAATASTPAAVATAAQPLAATPLAATSKSDA